MKSQNSDLFSFSMLALCDTALDFQSRSIMDSLSLAKNPMMPLARPAFVTLVSKKCLKK